MKLSVCMIVRDEEKKLQRCLDSVKAIEPYELLVCDTGSTDATLEIARACGAQVFHQPWEFNFAAARNNVLDLATGDWILSLDADEIVDPEGIGAIRAAMLDETAALWMLKLIDTVEAQSRVPRLFRNSREIRFKNRIHETVTESAEKYALAHNQKFKFLEASIHHDGYEPQVMAAKLPLYEKLYLEAIKDDPKSVSTWFHYAMFCLGQRQQVKAEIGLAECYRFVQEKYALNPADVKGRHTFSDSVAYYILLLLETKRPKKAIEVTVWSQGKLMGTPFLLFVAGRVSLMLKQYDQALKAFDAIKAWGTMNMGVSVRADQLERAIGLAKKRGSGELWLPT